MGVAKFFSDYKDALITVSWMVAAFGWVISNAQANRREKRKETRSEVDAICKAAAEVVLKCRIYFAELPTHDEDDARGSEIAFEVHRILRRTERLHSRVASFFEATSAGEIFFDAVTGLPFQSKTRQAVGPGSEKLRTIESSVHGLIDALEEGFTLAYSNPGRRWKHRIRNEWRNWWPIGSRGLSKEG